MSARSHTATRHLRLPRCRAATAAFQGRHISLEGVGCCCIHAILGKFLPYMCSTPLAKARKCRHCRLIEPPVRRHDAPPFYFRFTAAAGRFYAGASFVDSAVFGRDDRARYYASRILPAPRYFRHFVLIALTSISATPHKRTFTIYDYYFASSLLVAARHGDFLISPRAMLRFYFTTYRRFTEVTIMPLASYCAQATRADAIPCFRKRARADSQFRLAGRLAPLILTA